MTKSDVARCTWCGERFAVPGGPGRRAKYCRRSHRQRAYEARQLADARGLAPDEILVSADAWYELRDAVYVAETAASDAEVDVRESGSRDEVVAIVESLRRAIAGVVGALGEPRAVGSAE